MATGKAALISTLGTEPQVMTLSLYHLLKQHIPIAEAVGLYSQSKDPALVQAVSTLRQSWGNLPFSTLIKPRFEQIKIQDIVSEDSLKVTYREIHHWIHSYKSRGWNVYLNISGGRKPITICAFIAAQLLFSADDHLLYLVSSHDLIRSRELIGDPSQSYLIELPVPLWSEEPSILSTLASDDDPWVAAKIQREFQRRDMKRKWMYFMKTVLTPAERRVVEELVLRGGTNAEIGERIHSSQRTVGHQLSSTFRKMREFLDLSPDSTVDRTTVVSLLSPHIREDGLLEVGNPPDAIGHKQHYD